MRRTLPREHPYLITLLGVLIALGARHALDAPLDDSVPFSTFYGAVALAIYVGGVRHALLATLLGYLAADFFFVSPRYAFHFDTRALFAVLGYLFSCGAIIAIGAVMNRERRRAENEAVERARAIEALRMTEGRLSRILASDIASIAFWRPDGTITDANDAFLRLIGYERDELRDGRLNWRLVTPSEWNAADERAIEELTVRGVCTPFEKEYLRRDGKRVPVLLGAGMFAGNQEGVAFIIDISERRELEAQLQLRAEKLAEADRRKDEFLATLAHELRNPLAPIRIALELLGAQPGDSNSVERYRQVIDRQVSHLVRLVDDLLDVARITRGKVELRPERVPLASVVESAVETSRPAIDARSHSLSVVLPPEAVVIDVDPTRLSQVLANLLNNAAKFTPAGGRIEMRGIVEGRAVRFEIEDDGPGIAPDELERVFELFTQVGTPGTGLGLGLSLVKGLVELSGGSVRAHSDGVGKGSRFTVVLPDVVVPSHEATSEDPSLRGRLDRGRARRILVVDDNRDAAETLGEWLRALGHRTEVAFDGPSGLEAAARFHPELVLLDLGMPGMSGFDVARALRKTPAGRKVRLVALTGWGQTEDRRRTQEAGFDEHLVKPLDPADLERLLAALRPPAHVAPGE